MVRYPLARKIAAAQNSKCPATLSLRREKTEPRRSRTKSCRALFLSMVAVAAAEGGRALAQQTPGAPSTGTITINEYTVKGNHLLSEMAVDSAIYPYLGPGQTVQSVDAARAALQKAYADQGYQTVAVTIPPQHVVGGVITLQVVEEPIGRLHVVGARYFLPSKIRAQAPSLAPGTVPNFTRIKHDLIALNQWPDRQVIPSLQAGAAPQTVDVYLNVKDTLPLHGSLELNNHYSSDTTALRVNGALSYGNLWQRGDTINLAFQVAPQRPNDALVFSGSYLARVPGQDWLTLLFYGLVSNSKVATVGNINVVGRGQVLGARALSNLPGASGFFDTLSTGIDYKHFGQDISESGAILSSPITYYPITASYSASWQGDTSTTDLNLGPTFSIRGLGSDPATFENKRHNSQSNFIYLRSDISRQQDLPAAFQIYVKAQAQLADEPLVNSEQFSLGGQNTVRGYLESEVLGDDAITGSVELRSPPLQSYISPQVTDWRIFLFGEGGEARIIDPAAEQQAVFNLASTGLGTRVQLASHLNGAVDVAWPLITSVATKSYHPRLEFRVWVQF